MNIKTCVHYRPRNTDIMGLEYTIYEGYYNDIVTYDSTASLKPPSLTFPQNRGNTISVILNNSVPQYTVLYKGFFFAPTSGTYTFTTSSDDGSLLWLGPEALSGYTATNALVNNGGLHGVVTKSGTIVLTAGTYYPIRILFGQGGGGAYLSVGFILPNTTVTITDGNGYYYRYLK